jgi:hypothetical protein
MYDKKSKKITLIEGNHRIAFAKSNNIPYVPVKVTVFDENSNISSIPPSKLGLTTFQKYPEHPFLVHLQLNI